MYRTSLESRHLVSVPAQNCPQLENVYMLPWLFVVV